MNVLTHSGPKNRDCRNCDSTLCRQYCKQQNKINSIPATIAPVSFKKMVRDKRSLIDVIKIFSFIDGMANKTIAPEVRDKRSLLDALNDLFCRMSPVNKTVLETALVRNKRWVGFFADILTGGGGGGRNNYLLGSTHPASL